MSDIGERIAEVLAEHGVNGRKSWPGLTYCTCKEGWRGTNAEHHAHVAAKLLPIYVESTSAQIENYAQREKPSIKVDFDDPVQANNMMNLCASTALQRVADELAELPSKLKGQYVRYIKERSHEIDDLLRRKR